MPQVGTEKEMLIGVIFLLPNFFHYKNNSYLTNIELLKICYQTFIGQEIDIPNLKAARKIIYPTYFSSALTRGIHNERYLRLDKSCCCGMHHIYSDAQKT